VRKVRKIQLWAGGIVLSALLGLAGCGREDVSAWHVPEAGWRAAFTVSDTGAKTFRVRLPAAAKWGSVKVVEAPGGSAVPHWQRTLQAAGLRDVVSSREVHYGFPRMVRAKNGNLLVFYRVGTSHAYDYSRIAVRRSRDLGKTWSEERILHADPKRDHSSHNPVAFVTRAGRVILWVSSYGFQSQPRSRDPGYWSWSDDDGETWAPFRRFDNDPSRSVYYITDVYQTSDRILAAGTTFPPTGSETEDAYTLLWASQAGREWRELSQLTSPNEDHGDEVALMETEPGTILCLLRARRQTGQDHSPAIFRLWSHDGGKTWSERENIYDMLGCTLQRPFLTRLDESTLLLTGRDLERKRIVAYVSADNGRTFEQRHVLDHYQEDGGYTTGLELDANRVLLLYYSDSSSAPLMPDIKQIELTYVRRPEWLWFSLPEGATDRQVYLYWNLAAGTDSADRTHARLEPLSEVPEVVLGLVQTR
jgi:hypothetical protein